VNLESKQWHCWVCQEIVEYWDQSKQAWRRRCAEGGGGVIRLIQWLEECEFKEALNIVSDSQTWIVGSIKTLEQEVVVREILEQSDHFPIDPPEHATPISGPLPYLEKRGIDMTDVATYGLMWCPEGRYRNRLVFPVWEGAALVYWQCRAMYEAEAYPSMHFVKCLNPPRVKDISGRPVAGYAVSTDVLMNLDLACQYPRVAIVEGPADLIRSGPDTVCTFGKAISPSQISRLVRKGVSAIDLMWDGPTPREPDGAQPEMVRMAPYLSLFFDTRLVFLPHDDPGEHTREALMAYRAAGVPSDALSRTAYL